MAIPDPVERQKSERRRQIIEAAKAVFADAGYHGASIHAIIERAQIARGTFYLYFESKAAVFDSILDEAMRELRGRIKRIDVETPNAVPPQQQLREQVIATLEYIVQDRALATLLMSAGHTPDAEAAERLDQFFAEVRGLLERAMESGMEIGLLRKVDPQLAAAAMLGMFRGVVEQLTTQRQGPLPPIENVVAEVLMIALRGVLK